MSIINSLNNFRRKISNYLFDDMGTDSIVYPYQKGETPIKILLLRPNGRLGNLLLITSLLDEIETRFPNSEVDLFVKGGLASILFQNYKTVRQIIKLPGKPFKELIKYLKVWLKIRSKKYDLVISLVGGSTSGKLAAKLANGKYKYYGLPDTDLAALAPDYIHMAKAPVYNFRKNIGISNEQNIKQPVSPLSIKLNSDEIENGKQKLYDLVKNDRKTIGIYTFATGEKCLNENWWMPFYKELKARHGDIYNILEVLPKENVSQIDFAAISYYSTDIRELAAVLNQISLFITADCGIMHLASAANTNIVSLFSITSIHKYAPYNNKKCEAINVDEVEQENILKLIQSLL